MLHFIKDNKQTSENQFKGATIKQLKLYEKYTGSYKSGHIWAKQDLRIKNI